MNSVMFQTSPFTTIQQSSSLECFLISSTVTPDLAIVRIRICVAKGIMYGSYDATLSISMESLLLGGGKRLALLSTEAVADKRFGEKSDRSPSHQLEQHATPTSTHVNSTEINHRSSWGYCLEEFHKCAHARIRSSGAMPRAEA
jgi:hypothetical protein